jgi:hypothetical protein
MLTQSRIDRYFGPGPHGNGISWMSEYVIGRYHAGKLSTDERSLFLNTLRKCEKYPGLFKRGPWANSDLEAADDYIAMLGACCAIGVLDIPMRVHQYGVLTNGNYDNTGEKKLNSWLWRMPQVRAHMDWAAGLRPAMWRRIVWFIVVATSGRKPKGAATEFDTWRLASHLVAMCIGKSWFEDIAIKIFNWRFKRCWPGMMADVSFACKEGLEDNE